MNNLFTGLGYGLAGLAVIGKDNARMTEADKENIIMQCKDANSDREIEEIMDRIGNDDSWGDIAEIVDRIR
ncbi:MAG: hypothetical protein FWG91_01660 [Lachnospiraceae bacterium]|nr:hypothetical protein [Lachnospiraceae bacterium]